LLTPKDASEYLGLPQNTLAQYRSQKKGPPYFKIEGHLVRYSVDDLDEWLAKQRVSTAANSSRG